MLYACYDLIRPDVILEMSWRNGLHDFTMVCCPNHIYCTMLTGYSHT
jgi:hypothetical protein